MSKNLWQSWSSCSKIRNFLEAIGFYSYASCPVKQAAKENKKQKEFRLSQTITGWCSWYAFGREINEKKILEQARLVKSLGLNLDYILIDDGWCTWGDWKPSSGFPRGIKKVSEKLSEMGFKTGLWFAPFLASEESEVFKAHPEWFIRDAKENLLEGRKATPFDRYLKPRKYILDLSNRLAKHYIYSCIDSAIENGISLLKLDFLYAPYFDTNLKTDVLPHAYLEELFSYIKKRKPNMYIIASGCPYKPAKYRVDAIRISSDITAPQIYGIPGVNWIFHEYAFRLLGQNIKEILKKHYARYFNLDPDVFICSKRSGLSQNSISQLYRLVKSSRVRFLGDDLSKLSSSELKQIRNLLS